VHIHSVVGAGVQQPQDALAISQRATQLGLGSSAGIVHDPTGQIEKISERAKQVIEEIEKFSKPLFSFARHNPWRKNLLEGKPNDWHCPAGGRHLYICENGLVHYCMSQRGYPAIPLAMYTLEDVEREGKKPKACAPYCTIFCIHRVALLDRIRENPSAALVQLFPAPAGAGVAAKPPLPVRALTAVFGGNGAPGTTQFFRKTALRLLRIE